jgi:hypothetical protein
MFARNSKREVILAMATPALPSRRKAIDRAREPERQCRECGSGFSSTRAHSEFCDGSCRRAFHNRKARRGAQLFDLVMALRFDRRRAKELGAWSLLCRMATAFRAEDMHERDGRLSWDDPQTVRARSARFVAAVVGRMGRRRGRSWLGR